MTYNNQGNTTSNNSYVLNNKKLINIKKKLDKTIADYFNRVSGTTDKIKPYITQSWLNYTKENQYHHQHTHGNSLISGIHCFVFISFNVFFNVFSGTHFSKCNM